MACASFYHPHWVSEFNPPHNVQLRPVTAEILASLLGISILDRVTGIHMGLLSQSSNGRANWEESDNVL